MRFFLTSILLLGGFLTARALDRAAFDAAVDHYTHHRPGEAQAAFEQLASTEPANANIQFYLGRLALQRNDAAQAIVHLEKAAALDPQNSRIHNRLGDAYGLSAQKAGLFSKLGFAKKSLAAYEKAVALDPQSIDARWGLMEFYRNAPAVAGGGMDKAHAQALEIKQLDALRGLLAQASLCVSEKKYRAAFGLFEEALQVDPNNYTALFQLGRLAATTGENLERGLAALRQCLTQTPPAGQPAPMVVHWRIGNILEKMDDKPGARHAYENAVGIDPHFAPARDALEKLQ